jgi:fumarate hydratase class II
MVEQSLAMCTSLAPKIGYDKAAEIAKESFRTGKTVREIARAGMILSEEELAKALDPRRMTQPQEDTVGSGGGGGGGGGG